MNEFYAATIRYQFNLPGAKAPRMGYCGFCGEWSVKGEDGGCAEGYGCRVKPCHKCGAPKDWFAGELRWGGIDGAGIYLLCEECV